jgi:hypothetical protein
VPTARILWEEYMRIVLTKSWLKKATDLDILWIFSIAAKRGWEVLVK